MTCLCVFRTIQDGDVVQCPYGDGVVKSETMTGFGWHYHVKLFENDEVHEVSKEEVEKIDPFDDKFFDELVPDEAWEPIYVEDEVASGETETDDDLPTIEPPETKKRFVVPDSSGDVDDLAAERQAKLTQAQTWWAVKIFCGKLETN